MKDHDASIMASCAVKETTLLVAVHLLASSWEKVPAETVKNCFRKGGFVEAAVEDEEPPTSTDSDLTPQQYEEWMRVDENLQTAAVPKSRRNLCKCYGEY